MTVWVLLVLYLLLGKTGKNAGQWIIQPIAAHVHTPHAPAPLQIILLAILDLEMVVKRVTFFVSWVHYLHFIFKWIIFRTYYWTEERRKTTISHLILPNWQLSFSCKGIKFTLMKMLEYYWPKVWIEISFIVTDVIGCFQHNALFYIIFLCSSCAEVHGVRLINSLLKS